MRHFREAVFLLATVGLAACGESAAPPGPARSSLSVVAVRGSSDSTSDAIDSVDIVVRRSDSSLAGHGSAFFPPGVDTVPVMVTLTVTSDVETLTLTMNLLANGAVVFTTTSTITVRRGESNAAPAVQPAVWTKLSPSIGPAPRVAPGMAFDSSPGRKVLVMFGGLVLGQPQTDTWEFDRTAGWRVIATATSPPGRASHVMAYDPVRKNVVVFGGSSGSGTLNDTWTYDGTAWTKITPATSPKARVGATAAFDPGRGALVIFGGADSSGVLGDTWQYNGTTWTQLTLNASPTGRVFSAMAYDAARSRIELVGGYDTHNVLSDRWTLTAAGLGWVTETTVGGPGPRAGHVLVNDGVLNRLVLYGGTNKDTLTFDTWTFNGVVWTKLPATAHPPSSVGIGAAFFPTLATGVNRLVMFGGFDGSVATNQTWSIDTDWSRESDGALPTTREQAAFAHFPGVGEVMFGGSGGALDTWVFTNGGWVLLKSAGGPGPRQGAVMAYDGTRVVLFGGRTAAVQPAGDTWLFNGRTWTVGPVTGPSARTNQAMVYDPVGHKVVLFGGQSATGYLSDTWLWDGTAWTQSSATGPAARSGHSLVYDPDLRRIVLFGGAAGAGSFYADTWAWNGATWTQITTTGAITPRRDHAATYDADRGRMVVVGGQGDGASAPLLGDTWELINTTWSLVPLATGSSRPESRTGAVMVFRGTGLGSYYFGGRSTAGALNDIWSIR